MIHDPSPARIEAGLKVTGAARYPGEEPFPDLLHAALVPAPVACGRVRRIDAASALAVPGVAGLLTHETAPQVSRPGFLIPLQGPAVHFAGQAVAVVVADTPWAARHAAGLVRVECDPQPPVLALEAALDRVFAPEVAGRVATDSRRGDPEAGFAQADLVLDRRYTTATNNHVALELQVVTAWWRDDGLLVNGTTQAVFGHRAALAACFGLPVERVRVICRLLGGGFGAKGGAWFPGLALGVMVAQGFDRPVRLELTRAETFTQVGRRQQTVQSLRIGARRDGRLTAIAHHGVAPTSMFADYADPVGTPARMLYACPHVETTHRLVRLTLPQPNPMRAPGEGPGSFALESALDELAAELAIDPVALRLRLIADHDQHAGLPWSSNGLAECLRVAAGAFGWADRPAVPGTLRDGRRRIGWGMAAACYPVYRMACEAELRLMPDGTVVVRCGTQEMGTGTITVLAQLAAGILGLPLAQVRVELGATDLPGGPYSGASMVAASITPAVEAAALTLRRHVLEAAGAGPERPLTPAVVAAALAAAPAGLSASAAAAPPETASVSSYAFGAVFAEVRVDPDLGELRVTRLTAAYAAGRILNPRLARSQCIGGLIGGLGMALHEATVDDPRSGRVLTTGFADYLIPTHADMPAFDVHLVPEHDPHLAGGVKGIGMIGTVGTAAAIANALAHATGRRVRHLPIRVEDCLGDRA